MYVDTKKAVTSQLFPRPFKLNFPGKQRNYILIPVPIEGYIKDRKNCCI